ncbi:hypothetical protein LX16_2772 [Stackebrandtia albiflava]|uniref:ATPase AAA-type core domain-containing protein n=1 Tax=Stackebrandtia albiflava TaxID=406432 RepID=A0A562V2B1_9ACTN|nr:ATP-binding protein [Stackebrandtia albiflava]TWJ12026.1 hypothetical protein LX16_2772 [Stackebrandtia albiflava]
MLLRFRVANHASLRDEQELSLIADKPRAERAEGEVPRSAYRTVPATAIYGPNASGKSNVIDAIAWMRFAVLSSFRQWDPSGGVPRAPFGLRPDKAAHLTEVEAEFVLQGVRYQYGFACDDERITSEWLYDYPQGRIRRLFERSGDGSPKFGRSLTGRVKMIGDLLRPNSLYLSVAAAQGHRLLGAIRHWFDRGLIVATDFDFSARLDDTIERYLASNRRERADLLLPLLRLADVGVAGVQVDEAEADDGLRSALERMQQFFQESVGGRIVFQGSLSHRVKTVHEVESGRYALALREESSGTQTWIGMLGPVFEALAHGATLCVDELDARLHPYLSAVLVSLFQDPEVNPHRAQIVFTAHDTSLLGRNTTLKLERDQVWFTEKDHRTGATTLFPLSDFQERDSASLEKRYLVGRFGAVPFLDDDARAALAAAIKQHRNLGEAAEEPRSGATATA